MIKRIAAVFVMSAMVASAAEVSVVNKAVDAGRSPSATISNFDLSGGNALVVMVCGEGVEPAKAYYSVTYNGNPMTKASFVQEAQQGAGIYFVINPTVTNGDIQVTFDQESIYAVSALALDNVASCEETANFGEPETPQSLNYEGTKGGLVVATFADNTYKGGSPLTIEGSNINTYLQQVGGTKTLSVGRAQAYGSIAKNGSFTETFTAGSGSSDRNAGALATFSAK